MASPTQGVTPQSLREVSLNSIDVMTKALQRLRELRILAAVNPVLQERIEGEISTLELDLRIATIVHIRLQAATVTVKPLSSPEVERLDSLAQAIDETIERDAVVNATLANVLRLVEVAREVRDFAKSSVNA